MGSYAVMDVQTEPEGEVAGRVHEYFRPLLNRGGMDAICPMVMVAVVVFVFEGKPPSYATIVKVYNCGRGGGRGNK